MGTSKQQLPKAAEGHSGVAFVPHLTCGNAPTLTTPTPLAAPRQQPKHSKSITKREVLRKSLGLDKAAAYYKKQNPTAEGVPATLDVWVLYQMAKVNTWSDGPGAQVRGCCSADRNFAGLPGLCRPEGVVE